MKPCRLVASAMEAGILNAVSAMTVATTHENAPARCAFQRRAPRVTSIATMGRAATSAESHWAPKGLVFGTKASRRTMETPLTSEVDRLWSDHYLLVRP